MPDFNLNFPAVNTEGPAPLQQTLALKPGEFLFVLGPNGTGKSGLMHHFHNQNRDRSQRVTAHRQTHFQGDSVGLSSVERSNIATNTRNSDAQIHARYRDDYGVQKASAAVFDLYTQDGVYKKAIADEVIAGNLTAAQRLALAKGPLTQLNEIFRLSNLPVWFDADGDQLMASRNGGARYAVPKLSDGERGALVLAATVLTAPQESLLLIDEPERHLHRSIVTPLLRQLFERRADCGVVVSTHELELPADFPDARAVLVRGCTYAGDSPEAWSADILAANTPLEEGLKKDVLGARRNLLFVEGTKTSLDTPMYSILFPGVSLSPKDSCNDVEKAVAGIAGAQGITWVTAYGIVDGDSRTAANIAALKQRKVYAVDAYSVESIYYHPAMQERVALRKCDANSIDPTKQAAAPAKAKLLTDAAAVATIAKVQQHIDALALNLVTKDVRVSIQKQLPTVPSLTANPLVNIVEDATQRIADEKARITAACANNDVKTLITRYKIRSTGALNDIATKLGFKNTDEYEEDVLDLLQKDSDALSFARGFLGTLYTDIAV